MLELKFAIFYRAVSLPSQVSYAVLAEESLTRPGFLQTLPAHQHSISNSAILCNNYISLLIHLCACVHVKKKWCRKGSHSSSVSSSNCLVWLQIWKKVMGWCTAQWRRKKNILATFWFGTLTMLFNATGCVFHHENTRRWMVGCYNGL